MYLQIVYEILFASHQLQNISKGRTSKVEFNKINVHINNKFCYAV